MVVEAVFERSYGAIGRLASVHAAMVVTLYGLPKDARRDMEQEALMELWRKAPVYDPQRGSWRTFAERVVANRMRSLVRRMHSGRSGQFREEPLEDLFGLAAPNERLDLRADVWRVLAGVSQFDRSVAVCLMGHSVIETGQHLGSSRATIYRAVERLRAAFTEAGLAPPTDVSERDRERGVAGECGNRHRAY